MIPIKENNQDKPVCPHCESDLNIVHYRSMEATLGKRYIYFCPECLKCLGISHRKGFWMG